MEQKFLAIWDGPTPELEYRFDPTRKWRIDFAFVESRVAVEAEGLVHRIRSRFESDIEKYNELTRRGWRVYRYSSQSIESDGGGFVQMVKDALGQNS